MGRKRGRRGISFGSVLMIMVTVAVIAACALFLLAIVGEDVYERTATLIRSLSEQGLFERAPEEPAGELPAATAQPQEQEPLIATVAQEEELPPVVVSPSASSFTLTAAGTVYAPRSVRSSAEVGAESYDFGPVFATLGNALGGSDLAIATLETTTAGESLGYGSYNAPAELLDALRDCGVNVLSLATERALDRGYDGIQITMRELTSRSLDSVGVAQQSGDSGAQMLRVGGMQVAVLAYAYGLSDEGRDLTKADERGVVALIDEARMVRDITNARLSGANVVIVLPHWGTKNRSDVSQDVRDLAVRLAEAGADVILGAHPNVVQETERLSVTRSDGLTYETVVCYSLGSLLTDARTPENTAGMIARLTVSYDSATRRVSLGELACTPVYIACQREGEGSIYRVVDVENAAAMATLTDEERQNALDAAATVRDVTGQSAREEAGQG